MGYCVTVADSKFIIKKENFEKALSCLKSVFIPANMTCYEYVDGKKLPHFSWVETESVLNANTLEKALEGIRYMPIVDNNNIVNVKFIGDKYGDEEIFFNALASYVEKESYISFLGEDNKKFTWVFDGNTAKCIDN